MQNRTALRIRQPFDFGTMDALAAMTCAKASKGNLHAEMVALDHRFAVALPALCEPSAKYEVATILGVKPHQSAGESSSSDGSSYDVFVKVADTIYVVLYTDELGTSAVRYALAENSWSTLERTQSPTMTFGAIARSADNQPETGDNYEPVEVTA